MTDICPKNFNDTPNNDILTHLQCSSDVYCKACTKASATSTAIDASALSCSDEADASCCCALLRSSLAVEPSKFSKG